MDPSTAIKNYQFGERAKSELIVMSQLTLALTGFTEQERVGGRKMLLMMMESVRGELQFAHNSTGHHEYTKAISALNDAISLTESGQYEQASERIAMAISASTTPDRKPGRYCLNMDSSDFSAFLASRSSVREYENTPVNEEDLQYILSCAKNAPSAGNLEAWDVIVVQDEETKALLAEAAFGQEHIERAPVIFVVCSNYVRSMSRYGERGILYGLEDATIACTYLMLAAHAKKLQSCWTGAFDDNEVREILALPQHIRPISLLAVGKGHVPTRHPSRMDIGEHVHHETW